eukprot:Rmarinus@m.19527
MKSSYVVLLAAQLLGAAYANECVQGFGGDDGTEQGNGLGTTDTMSESERPRFKLPMCRMYNEDSCCSAIHDSEVLDAYEHLVDVGDRCVDFYNHKHFEVRQYMCMFCDPDHLNYFECCHDPQFSYNVDDEVFGPYPMADAQDQYDAAADDDKPAFYYSDCADYEFAGDSDVCNAGSVNSIRICESWAEDLWGDDGSHFDDCGMSVWSGADEEFINPGGIIFWGDVDGSTGDDPILPSKFWENKESFFRDTKPPLFDEFFIRIVPDSEGNCFDGAASTISFSAQLIGLSTLLALAISHIWV